MSILQVEHCSVCYRDGYQAVNDVSFAVDEQEIVSIVGESGSGKTTLIRAIMGVLPSGGRISEGHIYFQGTDIAATKEREMRKLRGKSMAMIFQDAGRAMDPIKKIRGQYVEAIRSHERLPKEQCLSMAEDMLGRMHLPDAKRVMGAYPFELSGGMKQRVGIAMAMTARPALLLADEPTSALDVTIQAQVVYQMQELRRQYGAALILVTHNMGVASYISDKIGVMKNGRMVEWGTRNQVIFQPKHEYTKKLLAAVPRLEGERFGR